jgi:hypothetical protein
MPFEHDIFVSYAHIDNQVVVGPEGWIETLDRVLALRVSQLRGKPVRIWRDKKLRGNDVFGDEIVEQLPKAATVVSVISPRYLTSEWCQRELDAFLAATAGGRVDNKMRVFKVVKTQVDRTKEPVALQKAIGYDFFTVDKANTARELSLIPALSSNEEMRLFYLKLDDLARDLAELLPRLEGAVVAPASPSAESKGCVYLAETTSDLREHRDLIRRELTESGYTVLPDEVLPLVGPECEAFVRKQLEKCKLSVHMLGASYGVVPEASTRSIVEMQYELAVERASAGEFCHLSWIPPGLSGVEEPQQRFLALVREDRRNSERDDVLEQPIADFKTQLHTRLNPPAVKKGTTATFQASPATRKRIYLISDKRDDANPLFDLLFQLKYDVVPSAFDGDDAQVRQDHEENLRECDGALVYYGAGNSLWLRAKLRETEKIAGQGRTKPPIVAGVYVAPPGTPEKERYQSHDVAVIRGAATPTADELRPFLERLA